MIFSDPKFRVLEYCMFSWSCHNAIYHGRNTTQHTKMGSPGSQCTALDCSRAVSCCESPAGGLHLWSGQCQLRPVSVVMSSVRSDAFVATQVQKLALRRRSSPPFQRWQKRKVPFSVVEGWQNTFFSIGSRIVVIRWCCQLLISMGTRIVPQMLCSNICFLAVHHRLLGQC